MKNLLLFFILNLYFLYPQGQLYHNQENQFKIKFPANWELKNGDQPHVVKKATSDDGSSIILLVINIITSEEINLTRNNSAQLKRKTNQEIIKILEQKYEYQNMSDKEILTTTDMQLAQMKTVYPDLKTFEKKIIFLNTKKFSFSKYSYTYKESDFSVHMTAVMYGTVHKGKYYQITGTSASKDYSRNESIIINSINTFAFGN
jgi:hypothetical protein